MSHFTQVFASVRKESPVLFWNSMIVASIMLVCIPGLFLDDRTLMGVNVWVKPLKFSISTAIYMLSVGFLITFYPYSRKKKKIISGLVAWSLLVEMLIIPMQAARGVQSHYNIFSALDGILFGCMGIFIGLNVMIMMLFTFDTMRLKLNTSKSVQWAILLGWIIIIVGSWVGGQMISQMSHNVGVADGGEGLPLLNWSTVAGDLRIAHFFGIHGLQVIPIFAWLLSRKWKTTDRNQVIVVTLFALMYAGWIGFTFWQAKQGMPLIALS